MVAINSCVSESLEERSKQIPLIKKKTELSTSGPSIPIIDENAELEDLPSPLSDGELGSDIAAAPPDHDMSEESK
jgi:hypothetical protein